jgi:hypothetical protein
MFSNKITQAIYSILGNKLKQSTVTNEEYGIQGDESETDGRNSNHGNKDIRNNEDMTKITQIYVDRNSKEDSTRMKMKQVIIVMTRMLKKSLVKLIIR